MDVSLSKCALYGAVHIALIFKESVQLPYLKSLVYELDRTIISSAPTHPIKAVEKCFSHTSLDHTLPGTGRSSLDPRTTRYWEILCVEHMGTALVVVES